MRWWKIGKFIKDERRVLVESFEAAKTPLEVLVQQNEQVRALYESLVRTWRVLRKREDPRDVLRDLPR